MAKVQLLLDGLAGGGLARRRLASIVLTMHFSNRWNIAEGGFPRLPASPARMRGAGWLPPDCREGGQSTVGRDARRTGVSACICAKWAQ